VNKPLFIVKVCSNNKITSKNSVCKERNLQNFIVSNKFESIMKESVSKYVDNNFKKMLLLSITLFIFIVELIQ